MRVTHLLVDEPDEILLCIGVSDAVFERCAKESVQATRLDTSSMAKPTSVVCPSGRMGRETGDEVGSMHSLVCAARV